jgi:hypothetical protein
LAAHEAELIFHYTFFAQKIKWLFLYPSARFHLNCFTLVARSAQPDGLKKAQAIHCGSAETVPSLPAFAA